MRSWRRDSGSDNRRSECHESFCPQTGMEKSSVTDADLELSTAVGTAMHLSNAGLSHMERDQSRPQSRTPPEKTHRQSRSDDQESSAWMVTTLISGADGRFCV